MILEGFVNLKSEREAFWNALFDTEIWREVIPDAEKYEKVGDNEFEGAFKVEFGPIKGTQNIKLIYSNTNAPQSTDFKIENQLVKKAEGHLDLYAPDQVPPPAEGQEAHVVEEGTKTVLQYKLDADTGNPIFNAALEGFKGKLKDGFQEFLGGLDARTK